jgi:uncharacterized protein YlxW (UPF0749 family)
MPQDIAPVFGMLILMSVPLAIILSRHQQKMAKILQGEATQNNESQQIRSELNSLRQDMRSLALSVELLRDEVKSSSQIESRIQDSNRGSNID